MTKYRYLVNEDEKIETIIVTKNGRKIKIPVDRVPFSEKPKIEEHLNAIFEMGIRIDLLTIEPVEGEEHAHNREVDEKIEKFVRKLSSHAKKLFLTLDNTWKSKSEVDRALGFENNPQKLAGVLSGITKRAKSVGLGDGRLIEQIYEGGVVKYRLTELGMKIKEKLSSL